MEVNKIISYKFFTNGCINVIANNEDVHFDFINTSDKANEERLELVMNKKEAKYLLTCLLDRYKNEKL